MQQSATLRLSLLTALLALAACGDDNPSATPDAGPGGADAATADAGAPAAACGSDLTVAAIDDGSWDERFTIAGLTGHDGRAPTVYDFARDVDGSLLVAGEFQWIGSDPVPSLARLRDGAWEPARDTWELPPPPSGFSAIAVDLEGDGPVATGAGTLALATYDDFGERDGEIWIDDGTGLRSIGAFQGLIRALAWFDGRLWAAGWFAIGDAGPDAIQGLAVWDGAAWSAPPGGPLDGFAFELLVDPAAGSGDPGLAGGSPRGLLVGGAFGQIGGITGHGVARYDGSGWVAFDFPDVAIYALARDADGVLHAGGALGPMVDGRGGLARWDGAAWQPVGGGLAIYDWAGVVTDILARDGSLYVTGCFLSAGGSSGDPDAVTARDVAAWDGAAWRALDEDRAGVLGPWLDPQVCGDEGPGSIWDVSRQRFAADGDHLFLGGSFPGIAGVQSQSLIRLAPDASEPSWSPVTSAGLGLGGWLDRVATGPSGGSDCSLYCLGTVTHVAGAPTAARLLRFAPSGDHWESFADPLPRDAWCPALAVSRSGEVAVGCMLFPAEGDAVGQLLRLAGDHLEPVATDSPLPPIQALAYDPDGTLWIGGGGATGYLARADASGVAIVEEGFDAIVMRVDASAGPRDLVVGGSFTQVGAVAASRIARWDGAAWHAIGTGLPGQVTAIGRDGATLYASSYDEGNGALLLGTFDLAADGERADAPWHELATPDAGLTPQPYFNFNAIAVVDGAVIAAGSATLDDGSGRGALLYQEGSFRPVGGGVRGIGISDLALAGDGVWFAGQIAEAGPGSPTLVPTVGLARRVMPGANKH
jgi:beta-propeller uncharacterized protein DUF5122